MAGFRREGHIYIYMYIYHAVLLEAYEQPKVAICYLQCLISSWCLSPIEYIKLSSYQTKQEGYSNFKFSNRENKSSYMWKFKNSLILL